MSEIRVRTSYPDSISCDPKRMEKIREATTVRIVSSQTKKTLAICEPAALIATAQNKIIDNGSHIISFMRMTFTPGDNYIPPQPKPAVILRKANR